MSDEPEIRLGPSPASSPVPPPPVAASGGGVAVLAQVLAAMDGHVQEDTTVEHGGVMVGGVDPNTGATVVTGSIRAIGAVSDVASLRFTHETWDHINAVLERDFPNDRMVGWYHSHPHFGIFLSDYDKFIHQNFFAQPWQIAYVRDPLLDQRGFFAWVGGELVEVERWDTLGQAPAATGPTGLTDGGGGSGGRSRRWWPVLAVLVLIALIAGAVVVLDPFGDDEPDQLVVLSPGDDRSGAPGTVITIGEASPAPGLEDRTTLTVAEQAEGDLGQPIPIFPTERDDGSILLRSLPPVGTQEGEFQAVVTARVCPEPGECDDADAEVDEQSLQFTVSPGDGIAVPQPSRWQPADDTVRALGDEVLVFGQGDALTAVDLPDGQVVGRVENLSDQTISQVAWPPGTDPAAVAQQADGADESAPVVAHIGFVRPDVAVAKVLDPEEASAAVSMAGGTGPTRTVAVVSPTRGVRAAVCRRGLTSNCATGDQGSFPRGSGTAQIVSVLELWQAMEEAAADETGAVVVGFDLPQCGSGDDAASGAVEDMFRVLVSPLLAHPETLWVFAADASANCPDGQASLSTLLAASSGNAISVSSIANGDASTATRHIRAPSTSTGLVGDVEAAALVASAIIEVWPGDQPATAAADCFTANADPDTLVLDVGGCIE